MKTMMIISLAMANASVASAAGHTCGTTAKAASNKKEDPSALWAAYVRRVNSNWRTVTPDYAVRWQAGLLVEEFFDNLDEYEGWKVDISETQKWEEELSKDIFNFIINRKIDEMKMKEPVNFVNFCYEMQKFQGEIFHKEGEGLGASLRKGVLNHFSKFLAPFTDNYLRVKRWWSRQGKLSKEERKTMQKELSEALSKAKHNKLGRVFQKYQNLWK